MIALDEYNIGAAFKAIEDELIASMIRNMDRHRAQETKEGIEWSMWQAEQLKALEKYKRENQKRYSKQFKSINGQIGELLYQARQTGNMQQEIQILKAIQRGYRFPNMPKKLFGLLEEMDGKTFRQKASLLVKRLKGKEVAKATAEFFKLNDRKLEALIKATTHDVERAEIAVLRMANDQYRKAIFNAQVYANSGAGTYEKAVDMATRDMLSRGLNCVEYANGARHTLSDYADMAIRTASKRAYLQGEGEKRQEWGIATVIMAKRGNPCPKCLPFVGKVLIDDVWSGGKKSDGPYPLMSTAIASGLYHPRCKDSHTTYFPGISTADDTWTKEELEAIGKINQKETKQQYADRQVERFGRLAEHSLDLDNKKKYQMRVEQWERVTGINKNEDPEKDLADWRDLLNLSEKQAQDLKNVHTELNMHMARNKTERLIAYSMSGNAPILDVIGETVDSVTLTNNDLHILKNAPANDIILSHVHPSVTGFSRADIDKLVNYDSIKVLTVVCPDGTKYILERDRYKKGLFGYSKYDSAYYRAEKEAQLKFSEFETMDEVALARIWPEYVDMRNQLLADRLGMKYRKVGPNER